MQELTKLDGDQANHYKTGLDPSLLHPHYTTSSRRIENFNFYQASHRQQTTSSLNEQNNIHPQFHPLQNPVTLVQSISVHPQEHQRRSSCFLSVREIKQLQESSRQKRRSSQERSRKIFVSIAKSNSKEKAVMELGGSEERKKIALTKYMAFRSNQKRGEPC